MSKEILSKKECLILGPDQEIKPIRNVDKIVEFLVLMSGQATVFDSDKRKDTVSKFGKKYLEESLKKTPEDRVHKTLID